MKPFPFFIAAALLAAASSSPSHASDSAWVLPQVRHSPPQLRTDRRETAVDCGDWRVLRRFEWYNRLNDIFALPGSGLMWAVGEPLYGPTGVVVLNGNPVVCRSVDGGFNWEIAQPEFASDSVPGANISLKNVHFFDSETGIASGRAVGAIGGAAVIYKTNDGGDTWTLVFESPPVTYPHNSVFDLFFADPLNGASHGWAVGSIDRLNNIPVIHTTDGGETWTPQASPINAAFTQVSFVDTNVGFVIANLGYTLGTTDGGSHWTILSVEERFGDGALALHFLDASTGVASNVGGLLLRTINGGLSWPVVYDAPRWIWDISFADGRNGWVVGEYGLTSYTEDAGVTWNQVSSLPNIPDLFGCVAVDTNRVWIAGRWGAIGYTLDAGGSWQNVTGPGYITTASLSDIAFVNDRYGWITGALGEMVRTTDGGETWTHSIQVGTNVNGIDFVNPLRGWFITADAVWRTDDGGASWSEIAALPPTVTDIEFHDEACGWTVGSGGAIHRTTDGGTTWVPVSSGTYENLAAVEFVNRHVGWAVGWDGTILQSTDGGLTWEPQVAPVIEPLYDVTFVSESTGWIAGLRNIIATTDGGASWQVQHYAGLIANINGIHFVDSQVGIAVGGVVEKTFIFMTSDGGATWTECDMSGPGLEHKLHTVFMLSSGHAYAAGQWGWVMELGDAPTGIGDNVRIPPGALEMLPSAPNPFGGKTRIAFRLAAPSDVTVEIYDVIGRKVFERTLQDVGAGEHTFFFDGRSTNGIPLPSGIYFQRVTALGEQRTAKFVIVR